jgi:pilus assembly protein Flp/PilA
MIKQRFSVVAERSQFAMLRMQHWLIRGENEQRGQGLVEYALILALIAILVIIALKFLQPQISNTLNKVSNNL